jgi:hypothetical protein
LEHLEFFEALNLRFETFEKPEKPETTFFPLKVLKSS